MKYVIHYHETIQSHYDFMIERDGYLETYRIDEHDMKLLIRGDCISARKIDNHRTEYLSYEGPVSCDRGYVRVFDTGEYTGHGCVPAGFIAELEGTVFQGIITVLHENGDRYSLRYSPGVNGQNP